jgi:hypothetical protein
MPKIVFFRAYIKLKVYSFKDKKKKTLPLKLSTFVLIYRIILCCSKILVAAIAVGYE